MRQRAYERVILEGELNRLIACASDAISIKRITNQTEGRRSKDEFPVCRQKKAAKHRFPVNKPKEGG